MVGMPVVNVVEVEEVMDEQTLTRLLQGLLAVLVGVVGWNLRKIVTDVDDVRADVRGMENNHTHLQLKIAEEYATKTDLNSARDESRHALGRIHERIDSMDKKIDDGLSNIGSDIKVLLRRDK